MSVAVFTPSDPITVTDTARKHFRERIQMGNAKGIRLKIVSSGCTGYMYDLALAEEASPDDLIIPLGENLNLQVDRQSLPMLYGTQIDFVKDGLNRVLRFNNPNATDHCGCGESFNIVGDEAE